MFCPNCGGQVPDDSVFCDNCGANLAEGSTGAGPGRASGTGIPPKTLAIIGAGAVVIIGAVAAFFLLSGGDDNGGKPADGAEKTATTARTGTAKASPSAAASKSPAVTATGSPSAKASASASPSASASASPGSSPAATNTMGGGGQQNPPTSTPVPPTSTPIPTATPTNTVAPTPTPTPTNTPIPTPTATATTATQGLVYGTVLVFDDSACGGCKIRYVGSLYRVAATASSAGYYQVAMPPGWYYVEYYCPVGGGMWVPLDDSDVYIEPGPQKIDVYFGFCG